MCLIVNLSERVTEYECKYKFERGFEYDQIQCVYEFTDKVPVEVKIRVCMYECMCEPV